MSGIYSTRFFADVFDSSGSNVLYTVPAGFVAVLRCVDVVISGTTGADGIMRTAGRASWYVGPAAAAVVSYEWRGRQVLYEGEEIGLNVDCPSGAFIEFTGSGYLFAV